MNRSVPDTAAAAGCCRSTRHALVAPAIGFRCADAARFPLRATYPRAASTHAATAVIRIGQNPIFHSPSFCRRNIVRTLHSTRLLAFAAALSFGSAPVWAANHNVTVGPSGSFTFSPPTLNIAAGDTVTFTNDATGFHNAVSDDGTTFNSGAASSSAWVYVATFPTPGTFGYHCTIHGGAGGQGMSGTINVTVPVDLQSFDVN
jgi:plastocyanin